MARHPATWVSTEKKGIRNGCLYTVKSIDKEAEVVVLADTLEKLTFDQVKAWLRLSFAQTYASVQGWRIEATRHWSHALYEKALVRGAE